MLLICNGAQKSGSTWLYNILTALVSCESPDAVYLTGNSKNPCIRPGLLAEFLDTVDYRSVHYISKNHLNEEAHRDLLLSRPDVYVFDIERDPRDVVVSLYYDARNRHGYDREFAKFYWQIGRGKVARLNRYHSLWRSTDGRSLVANYERLKTDFPTEVRAIAGILGIELSDGEVAEIRESTSMDSLRKKYAGDSLYSGSQFFRKGIVGDWQNHLDAEMLDDIDEISTSGMQPGDWRFRLSRLRHQFFS